MNKLLAFTVALVVGSALSLTFDVHPILNGVALLLFMGLTVHLGSQADYWRMRSREFYEFQQDLVNKGIIKYDALWRTKKP